MPAKSDALCAVHVQAVQTVDFWLLFWACACGMGSGLVLLNNLGQLTDSLGGGTDSQVCVYGSGL